MSFLQKIRWPVMLLALAFTTACASTPPANYYLLSALDKGAQSALADTRVGIKPITGPEYLTRSAFVAKMNGELIIDPLTRWGEPLEDGVARTLAINLIKQIPGVEWVDYPWATKNRPDVEVTVTILELLRVDSSLNLIARVTVIDHRSDRQNGNSISLSTDIRSGSPLDITEAHNQLIAELAGVITESITNSR